MNTVVPISQYEEVCAKYNTLQIEFEHMRQKKQEEGKTTEKCKYCTDGRVNNYGYEIIFEGERWYPENGN